MDGISELKIQILRFLYFVYFESEKQDEDFENESTQKQFWQFVRMETERLDNFTSCTQLYFKYLFETLLKILN